MRNILMILLLTVFAVPALARTTTVTGRGRDSGFCNGNQGSSCVNYIENRAQREGIRDAEWRCRSHGGQSRTYTTSCNTACFPNFISPKDRNVAVQCSATCSMQCEI